VYISGLNSGQWHSGDELIDIMWDDSWQIMWDGSELTGFHSVQLGYGPWFDYCCYKSRCSPTLATFYAGLQQCWIIGFWTVTSSTVFHIIWIW
jgi:hypothetical protein